MKNVNIKIGTYSDLKKDASERRLLKRVVSTNKSR